jgi:uncharacterized membrane protein
MFFMTRLVAPMAAIFALVTLSAAGADDVKTIAGGKGSAFKSKSFEVKEKGEVAVVLSFEAGKEVTVTTSGDKDVDVHLMVKGKYFEAKDTSPGPNCLVKFTPVKGDDNFTLTIKNNGYGANKLTLNVKVDD